MRLSWVVLVLAGLLHAPVMNGGQVDGLLMLVGTTGLMWLWSMWSLMLQQVSLGVFTWWSQGPWK